MTWTPAGQVLLFALSFCGYYQLARSVQEIGACGVRPQGWYDASSYDTTTKQWTDISGSGNDVVTTGAGITDTGTFDNGRPYLTVPMSSPIVFPVNLQNEYTVFSVTSYAQDQATNRNRILTGMARNWLSGHWAGQVGVSHHDAWIIVNREPRLPVDQWVFGADQRLWYHAKTYDDNTKVVTATDPVTSGNTGLQGPLGQISINGAGEQSDAWVAEVILFTSELSPTDITCVEDYLLNRYTAAVGRHCGALEIDYFLQTCSAIYPDTETNIGVIQTDISTITGDVAAITGRMTDVERELAVLKADLLAIDPPPLPAAGAHSASGGMLDIIAGDDGDVIAWLARSPVIVVIYAAVNLLFCGLVGYMACVLSKTKKQMSSRYSEVL
jgi:hypothetical protein